MNNFYTYIYLDPRKPGLFEYGEYEFYYEPFYVGKGKDDRINDKKNDHCEYKINKIKEFGFETVRIKVKENIEEMKAFELEIELIELVGRENLKEGPLANLVDGGEGSSGYIHTEETKELIAEKLRKEYPEIKNAFEKIKYNLKTEEKDYENAFTKLEYICDRGHEHSISWSSFQQGHGCPYCYGNKIDFSDIKKAFEKNKCKLRTEEKDYKNCYTKLKYECPRGHEHSISWSNFQQEQGCPICGREKQVKKQRKNFKDIKKEFERRECKLRTEEKDYKNAFTKLEYECPKGHRHSISWNNFQQRKNNYCPKCNRRN